MKKILFYCIIGVLTGFTANSQTISGTAQNKFQNELSKKFETFEVYDLNIENTYLSLEKRGGVIDLDIQLGSHAWKLELFQKNMFAKNYVRSLASNTGVNRSNQPFKMLNYIGNIVGQRGSNVSFNISDQNMVVQIEQADGKTYFIETVIGLVDGATKNDIVVYETSNIIHNKNIVCGFEAKNNIVIDDNEKNEARAHCVTIEVALSCDFTVVAARGQGAEAWMGTILALVATNFDNDFGHAVELLIGSTWVPTTPGSDPFQGIFNINEQLTMHQNLGNQGFYGGGYAVATNWTRKFFSGVVGLAFLPGVCRSDKYNVCSDFSSNDNTNRQLQAHELGHNFNSGHDGAGTFIMSPSVNGSNTWSANSQRVISDFIQNSVRCATACQGIDPPMAAFKGTPRKGCIPFKVQFTDLSTGSPTSWLWDFPGGNPTTSRLQNPLVTYNTPGIYEVTLRVSNAGGFRVEKLIDYIEVTDVVVTNWNEVIDERDVQFNNTSLRGDTYMWKFGDGTTSTEESPFHQYVKDGKYTVCLKVTNFCGSKEVCRIIDVASKVYANYSEDRQDGCAPFKVKFKNESSDNVVNYFWSFPGGTPSSSTMKDPPTIEYKKKGEYDVTLRVTNSKYQDILTKYQLIVADTMPKSIFTYYAVGLNYDFTNLSHGAIGYTWHFGDNSTSNDINPSHLYPGPGTYNVRLICFNLCGVDTLDKQIVISSGLAAGFKVPNQKGCTPYTVTFENTSQDATSYSWAFPGGNPSTSTMKNPTVTYAIAGTYDVELIASDGVKSDKVVKTQYIDVDNTSTASFDESIAKLEVSFNNLSQYGSTFEWNFGDNTGLNNEKDPKHTYAAEGEYKVKLKVTNNCGTSTFEKIVAVYLIPKVNFSSNYRKICAGDTIKFKDLSSIDVKTWAWQFSGANINSSNQQNPFVVYDKAGIYGVKLTVTNSNGSNELIQPTYVEVISSIKCPKKKKGGKTEGPEFQGNEELISRNTANLQVIPNPARDYIIIKGLEQLEGNADLKLMDINGKIVIEKNDVMQSKLYLPISLHSGIYYMVITDNLSSYKKKIVIE